MSLKSGISLIGNIGILSMTVSRLLFALLFTCILSACSTLGIKTVPNVAPNTGGLAQIAVQAPIGLPQKQNIRLGDQLITALQQRSVTMAATPQAPARFKLQGFCSASANENKTSIACVWDANASDGTRAHRIVIKETVGGSTPSAPWSAVSNSTLDRIAVSVGDKIAAWLDSSQIIHSEGQHGSGFSLPTLSSLGLNSDEHQPISVHGVQGAPGDGNSALANSMISSLRSLNIPISNRDRKAFQLFGTVNITDGKSGKQNVTIEWSLKDEKGIALGTVTQNNQVPQGALDGTWGGTAKASANAAAKRIADLLPGSG
jgi:hypothetical protein